MIKLNSNCPAAVGLAATLLLVTGIVGAAEVTHISWMLGCWSSNDVESTATERWSVGGAVMTGISEVVRDSERVVVERMTISKNADGNLEFSASPLGQPNARFVMVSIADDEIVFENREHDFPQRIIYRLLPGFDLLGRIEGVVDGKAKSADFPMHRTACPDH